MLEVYIFFRCSHAILKADFGRLLDRSLEKQKHTISQVELPNKKIYLKFLMVMSLINKIITSGMSFAVCHMKLSELKGESAVQVSSHVSQKKHP